MDTIAKAGIFLTKDHMMIIAGIWIVCIIINLLNWSDLKSWKPKSESIWAINKSRPEGYFVNIGLALIGVIFGLIEIWYILFEIDLHSKIASIIIASMFLAIVIPCTTYLFNKIREFN